MDLFKRTPEHWEKHTKNEEIRKQATDLWDMLNNNSYFSLEDLEMVSNIIRKSKGLCPLTREEIWDLGVD